MPALRPLLALTSLRDSGFEILDRTLAQYGEVTIASNSPFVPELDDTFIIESDGHAHDVTVFEITRFADGGWRAVCRVCGWV